jgi:serine/threonine protein kinase/formylglycine-generating enzyme required for sulfatase activity
MWEPPSQFEEYRIIRPLGQGGMGSVYLAQDEFLERPVAIKFMRDEYPTAIQLQRFHVEARSLARLQHDNVMAVYRVGRVDGVPYIVGEFIDGTSLAQLPRPVDGRQALAIALDLARGLAAIHRCGVLHRDLTPSNAIQTRGNKVKLVDFGVAKLLEPTPAEANPQARVGPVEAAKGATSGGPPTDSIPPHDIDKTLPADDEGNEPSHTATNPMPRAEPPRTKPGKRPGTPRYQAPELWEGQQASVRSDLFALGAVLFELCSGHVLLKEDKGQDLASSVKSYETPGLGALPPAIPRRLATVIRRCLARDPSRRFESAQELYSKLYALDMQKKIPQRTLRWAAGFAVFAALIGISIDRIRAQYRFRQTISASLNVAEQTLQRARQQHQYLTRERQSVLNEFRDKPYSDNQRRASVEHKWRIVLQNSTACHETYTQAILQLETTLRLDGSSTAARHTLATALSDEASLYEEEGKDLASRRLLERLKVVEGSDSGRLSLEWREPARVNLSVDAPKTEVEIFRYHIDREQNKPEEVEHRPMSASVGFTLSPGSYLFVIKAPGRAITRMPLLLHRSERKSVTLRLPRESEVPSGFVYVPAGEFLFGSGLEEERMYRYLSTVPIHKEETGSYFIAQHETTFGQWIDFLNALPPEQREKNRPIVTNKTSKQAQLELKQQGEIWWLTHVSGENKQRVAAGAPLIYSGRTHRKQVDWLRLPVVGITAEQAQAYVAWLRQSGKVPGARLCTDLEWERAARGADNRLLPHGNRVRPDDLNFDETYDRKEDAMGPDEVGSHPESRSPFGVDDMAGNVWEYIVPGLGEPFPFLRSGSAYYGELGCLVFNRESGYPTLSNQRTGMRVCADVPGHRGGL